MSPFKWKTLTLLTVLLIALIVADSDSDSSEHKDEHSEDSPEKIEKEKEKNKEKKEKKEKEKKEDEESDNYDYETESMLNDRDIDAMFSDPITTKSPSATGAPTDQTTTPSAPLGVFGPDFWESLSKTTQTPGGAPEATTGGQSENTGNDPNPEDDKTSGESGQDGHRGNIFYPLPRPIDIWDRLFVLAAFPICFAAIMLKAEMFR